MELTFWAAVLFAFYPLMLNVLGPQYSLAGGFRRIVRNWPDGFPVVLTIFAWGVVALPRILYLVSRGLDPRTGSSGMLSASLVAVELRSAQLSAHPLGDDTMTTRKKVPPHRNPFAGPKFDGVEITINAEAADVINVEVQLLSGGEALPLVGAVQCYLSDNDDGSTLVGTAPTTVAIGTDGLLIEPISNKSFTLVTEDDGHADINVTDTGSDTWYFCVILPDGSVVVSGAITVVTTTTTTGA